ncbi:MAG TPA: HD domain-containing protein [Flavobacteriales bacterium]|nr:HD domain-containing protein [Flavobacteriales bacterium]
MATINLTGPVFELLRKSVSELDVRAFVIGGYVRDELLGRPCKDIDVVVEGSGIDLAKKVAAKIGKGAHVNIFKNFGTAMIHFEDLELEFVGARKESYRNDSRKPIVEDGTIQEDQERRDFTINALAIALHSTSNEVIDPFSGLEDLRNGILRTPLAPDQTYSDDPLRMMRAIRFASQLGFEIEKDSLASISRNKDRIRIVSKERIAEELNKIVLSPVPSVGFKHLFDTGLLQLIFPEMAALYGVDVIHGKAHKDNFYHTLQVLDNISEHTDNLWLRWSAILHDIAKPATKRFEPEHGWTFHGHEDKGARMVPNIFRNLKLPQNEKMKYVQKLVQLHLRPIVLSKETVTDSAVRRLLFEAGDEIDDLMILCQADITSKNKEKVKRYLANFEIVKKKLLEIEEKDRLRNWQPPVSGIDIMETFGIGPGIMIGQLKSTIREAILEGDIQNCFPEAYQFMLKEGEKLGLTPVRILTESISEIE